MPHVKERFTIEAQVMKPVGDVLDDTLRKAAWRPSQQRVSRPTTSTRSLEPILRARLAALRYLLQSDDAECGDHARLPGRRAGEQLAH